MLRNAKGFTLIELMVVVVIIGILAAIALPNFIAMQDRAKEASVKSNMHTVQLGMEDSATQTGGIYPEAIATIRATMPNNALPANPFSATRAETTIVWIQRAVASQGAATATVDTLGGTPAFSQGNLSVSVGPATTANTSYAITGSGKAALLQDRGALLVLHN